MTDDMKIYSGNEVQITDYLNKDMQVNEIMKIQSRAMQDHLKIINLREFEISQLLKENEKLKGIIDQLIEENGQLKNELVTKSKFALLSYGDSLLHRIEELQKKL